MGNPFEAFPTLSSAKYKGTVENVEDDRKDGGQSDRADSSILASRPETTPVYLLPVIPPPIDIAFIMYARALTLFLFSASTLVAASPIDSKQANVIAENHNIACSGPQGCQGANSTEAVDAAATSGASRTLTMSSGAVVAAVVFANLL
ncbi:hypothetical protein GSI_04068 [Ganoderma sinense ZZ0214-1]|uniref:Uncharacterized protein n=1 Tax=Ganoderma sinense ZZ0214-1 TaxID=1077348 RepID=A0A2G8SI49_9APHY|nr:hypothetical protein GSI_04068 [Ganoderma sinense ZZ0214-1]